MSTLLEKDKQLLHDFLEHFDVFAHSYAIQEFSIDQEGYPTYSNTFVTEDTVLLEIMYDDYLVCNVDFPSNDLQFVLSFAKEWDEAGRPLPGEDTDFFKGYRK